MIIDQIDLKSWNAVEAFVTPIKTKKRYKQMLELAEGLLAKIGEAKSHPMIPILETVSVLIEDYEDKHINLPKSSPIAVLKYLMEEHKLNQSQLPEIGSQSVVSNILKGTRTLNLRQIKALAKRFNLSVDTFV